MKPLKQEFNIDKVISLLNTIMPGVGKITIKQACELMGYNYHNFLRYIKSRGVLEDQSTPNWTFTQHSTFNND